MTPNIPHCIIGMEERLGGASTSCLPSRHPSTVVAFGKRWPSFPYLLSLTAFAKSAGLCAGHDAMPIIG